LGKHENLLCQGHGFHNLVYTDGIKKTEAISDILKKVRNIVKALRYKTGDFHNISEDPQSRFDDLSDDEAEEESDEESDDFESDDEQQISRLSLSH